MELPCNVGDTVYFETWINNGSTSIGIQGHKVKGFNIEAVVRGDGAYDDTHLPIFKFGNHIFLDKEQAEARLKELEEKK